MKLIVKGRNGDVPADVRAYAEEKVGKVDKILNSFIVEGEVELFKEKNPAIENNRVAEITIFTKGPVIRARESATTYQAAVDLAGAKIERQARKIHGKFVDKRKHAPAMDQIVEVPPLPEEVDEAEGSVVKMKTIDLKPMTSDEAIMQLELLQHDFFVFADAETDGVAVLYRRNDGDYGLIAPRLG
jgi:putative sigma-54 modulation protein